MITNRSSRSPGVPQNPYRPPKNHRHLAVIEAIKKLFPSGVGGICANRRDRQINEYLVANGQEPASASAIVRALNDLASQQLAPPRSKRPE